MALPVARVLFSLVVPRKGSGALEGGKVEISGERGEKLCATEARYPKMKDDQ